MLQASVTIAWSWSLPAYDGRSHLGPGRFSSLNNRLPPSAGSG